MITTTTITTGGVTRETVVTRDDGKEGGEEGKGEGGERGEVGGKLLWMGRMGLKALQGVLADLKKIHSFSRKHLWKIPSLAFSLL